MTSHERPDWRALCLKLRDAVQAEGQAMQWGAGVKRARRELAAVWEEVDTAEKSPVETTTSDLERLRTGIRQLQSTCCGETTDPCHGCRALLALLGSPVETSAPVASAERTIGFPPCFFCGCSIGDHRTKRVDHPWREGVHVTDHDLEKARLYFVVNGGTSGE